MIKAKNVDELVKKINNTKDLVVVEGGDDKINRAALENTKVDILLGPEKNRDRDFTHYRNSGLNQVLCKLTKKNNIAIAFNFNLVLNNESIKRSQILGRMMQNVRFCRKYKINTVIASFASKPEEMRNAHDLVSFGVSIGMHPKQAKESLKYIENL